MCPPTRFSAATRFARSRRIHSPCGTISSGPGRVGGRRGSRSLDLPRGEGDEVRSREWDVAFPLAQRGKLDQKHAQTVVEVLAEAAARTSAFRYQFVAAIRRTSTSRVASWPTRSYCYEAPGWRGEFRAKWGMPPLGWRTTGFALDRGGPRP